MAAVRLDAVDTRDPSVLAALAATSHNMRRDPSPNRPPSTTLGLTLTGELVILGVYWHTYPARGNATIVPQRCNGADPAFMAKEGPLSPYR